MSTSSVPVDVQIEALKTAAADLLSAPLTAIEEVGGGRNSRVYRLRVEPHQSYALKAYFRHASESRARMETEFGGLEFLWKGGVRNIPKPVAASVEHGFAIYTWLEGHKITATDVNAELIQSAVDFLRQLADLGSEPGSDSLRPASEACFSGRAIVQNLEGRLERLRCQAQNPELRSYLTSRLQPAFDRIHAWSQLRLREAFDEELGAAYRILSPSDFGFHNALKNESGQLFFLDFEYFGWDDPAKTVSDFLLHPGMAIPPDLKRQFATNLVQAIPGSDSLRERVQAYYPLFGLKWCVILLNEFLPDQLLRRRFSGMTSQEVASRQMEQLAKSESMLETTLSEYERFHYFD